mgnify:FL=1
MRGSTTLAPIIQEALIDLNGGGHTNQRSLISIFHQVSFHSPFNIMSFYIKAFHTKIGVGGGYELNSLNSGPKHNIIHMLSLFSTLHDIPKKLGPHPQQREDAHFSSTSHTYIV